MNYSNCELILDIAKRFGVQGSLCLIIFQSMIVVFSCVGWMGSCIGKSEIT